MGYRGSEKQKETMRVWRGKNRDRLIEYARLAREKNRDRNIEQCRDWKKRNPEKVKAQQQAWYLANADLARAKRRAKKAKSGERPCRNCGKTFTPQQGNDGGLFCSHDCYARSLRGAIRAVSSEESKNRYRRHKEWKLRNKEKVKEATRKQYANDSENRRNYSRKYAKMNPDRCFAHRNRRRALKANAQIGTDREAYRAFVGWAKLSEEIPCNWCGNITRVPVDQKRKSVTRHIDHIMPLSRGGRDCVTNLCVSCPRCNQRKHAKLPEEFLSLLSQEQPVA